VATHILPAVRFSRLLLVGAVVAWLIGVGGYLFASVFRPQATILTATMSPSTFASVTWVFVGWWLAVAVFGLSLVALAASRGARTTALLAALVSGVYAVPIAVLLLR
jgi:hypothetical protein